MWRRVEAAGESPATTQAKQADSEGYQPIRESGLIFVEQCSKFLAEAS
jgi:hypothetical protein